MEDVAMTMIEKRLFPATGDMVSVLGLGTVKFGRNTGVKYPGGDGFALPDDGLISSILDLCIDHGVNLIDTAPAYGISEARLGQVMGARRDKFFLVTKTGEEFDGNDSSYIFTRDHTEMSVERSLSRLRTDVLDCVLVHSNRDDMRVIDQTDVLPTLARLKEAGKIRSFGVSTYTVSGGKKAVELSDAVMVAYNAGYQDEKDVIAYAAESGRAVLVKKGLASGHIANLGDFGANVRYVTETPGVTSLVFGSLKPQNILANIKALTKG